MLAGFEDVGILAGVRATEYRSFAEREVVMRLTKKRDCFANGGKQVVRVEPVFSCPAQAAVGVLESRSREVGSKDCVNEGIAAGNADRGQVVEEVIGLVCPVPEQRPAGDSQWVSSDSVKATD